METQPAADTCVSAAIPDTRTAEELVRSAQGGDEQAFHRLVDIYDPRVIRYMWEIVEDQHLAQDLAQEVWLKVVKGLTSIRDAGRFEAWLFATARTRIHDYFRSRAKERKRRQALEDRYRRSERRKALKDRYRGSEEDCRDSEQERSLLSKEERAVIEDCLRRLPRRQAEVATLRFLEDMSETDIAVRLNLKSGTVKSRLHYAREGLKEDIEDRL